MKASISQQPQGGWEAHPPTRGAANVATRALGTQGWVLLAPRCQAGEQQDCCLLGWGFMEKKKKVMWALGSRMV